MCMPTSIRGPSPQRESATLQQQYPGKQRVTAFKRNFKIEGTQN